MRDRRPFPCSRRPRSDTPTPQTPAHKNLVCKRSWFLAAQRFDAPSPSLCKRQRDSQMASEKRVCVKSQILSISVPVVPDLSPVLFPVHPDRALHSTARPALGCSHCSRRTHSFLVTKDRLIWPARMQSSAPPPCAADQAIDFVARIASFITRRLWSRISAALPSAVFGCCFGGRNTPRRTPSR